MPLSRTIRLTLEYDGTSFVGWQIQERGRSIQGELARALRTLLQEEVRPIGSGRTDAGTHALGQVAHFRTESRHPPRRIQRALNSLLPPEIAVVAAEEARADFHARYGALSKRYRYRICSAKTALRRDQVWVFHRPLDLDLMVEAARALPGVHEFFAFCKRDPEPASFTCRVLDCGWQRREGELVFEIEANRFLRHMVRILVGTLVQIGQRKRPPEDLGLLLEARQRERAGPTAPARGLCLVRVEYPDF